MPLHIVLVEPLIPQNTGSIGRLSAATGSQLHLIEPLGFELSDRYLKRAGLDYWPEISLSPHRSWQDFLAASGVSASQMWFVSTKAKTPYTDVSFQENDFLVFGNESRGFPPQFYPDYAARLIRIPMDNPKIRSLNLACAVSVVVYEARRQMNSIAAQAAITSQATSQAS